MDVMQMQESDRELDYTVEELMEVLGRDEHYYLASGGGITFSGGEPLMYSKFIHACARKIRKRGWNILIEDLWASATRKY